MTLDELIHSHETLARCDSREKSKQWHDDAANVLRKLREQLRATVKAPP